MSLPSIHVVFLLDFPQNCGHHEQGYKASRKGDEKLLQLQFWMLTERDLKLLNENLYRFFTFKLEFSNTVIWIGERKS